MLARARECPGADIALVAATMDEARKVMIEGESGLIAVGADGETLRWVPSRRMLLFPSGARAFAYSGVQSGCGCAGRSIISPGATSSPNGAQAEATWDNLMLGLQAGTRPRAVVTTTPRPIALLTRIIGDPSRRSVTGGRTADNPHLPRDFLDGDDRLYAGTRLGRQELDGELIDDVAGALWTRDADREAAGRGRSRRSDLADAGGDRRRSARLGGRRCVRDRRLRAGADGVGYVLADRSAGGLSPEGWAAKVAAAAEAWGADRVVAESKQWRRDGRERCFAGRA